MQDQEKPDEGIKQPGRTGAAAKVLKLHQNTVRKYCDQGLIPCIRDESGNRIFDLAKLQALKLPA